MRKRRGFSSSGEGHCVLKTRHEDNAREREKKKADEDVCLSHCTREVSSLLMGGRKEVERGAEGEGGGECTYT